MPLNTIVYNAPSNAMTNGHGIELMGVMCANWVICPVQPHNVLLAISTPSLVSFLIRKRHKNCQDLGIQCQIFLLVDLLLVMVFRTCWCMTQCTGYGHLYFQPFISSMMFSLILPLVYVINVVKLWQDCLFC